MIVAVWVALNISYYGLFLWLPFVLQSEEQFSINVYLLLALSALSQFPGYGGRRSGSWSGSGASRR